MPCYHPMKGYRSKTINPTGKRSITFNMRQGFVDQPVEIPCGQCIGCRLERSRQWAVRLVHESQLHEHNSFITLTYNNQNLPSDNSLHKDHFQKFMKRLRKNYNQKIRFFHCGEYGENFGRPHYHAIIFNLEFTDKKHWKTINDQPLYTSEILEKLWPHGFSTIGNVTFESAAYVARYVTKKVTGKNALHHYNKIDMSTGEITESRIPEYVTMSRRPGIAKLWFDKYHTEIYPEDILVLRNKKMKPTKYYNTLYERSYPSDYKQLKFTRIEKAKANAADNTRDRLEVKEYIQHTKHDMLKRNYENGT